MGLDMYLYAKQSLSFYWGTEEIRKKVKSIARLMKGTKFIETDEHSRQFAEIKLQVGYWRKANQVHKYFVDNCADGKDEWCQDTYVEREHLEDLLNRCETVMKDHSRAEELLPAQSGFFFGSTEYDGWYYSNLEYTIPILKKILKDAPKDWEFEYHASW